MTSIRRRLSLLVALSMTGVLAAGGLALWFIVRAALTAQFDGGLAARADALRSLIRVDAGHIEMDIAGEVLPRYQGGTDAEYFLAWTREDGGGASGAPAWRVLEASESMGGRAWSRVAHSPPPTGVADDTLPDGRAGRALTIEFVPIAEHEGADGADHPSSDESARVLAAPVRLTVAQSRHGLDRTLWTIALAVAGVGLTMVLSALALTHWAVRRGTTPLGDLSAQVARIGPSSLDQRLNPGEFPAELAPVAERLNDLLARLHAAFERERRFSAAASHELRTPIAELRMLLEVALSRPRSGEEWAATGERAVGVLDRAQSLCEALLRLSRAESGAGANTRAEPITLGPILAEQAARAVALHGGDARRLRVECAPDLTARIDPTALATIVGNLFDNALRHGHVTPDRPAECLARADAERITITVRNHAPNLLPADVPRLFEPFWQADASRARREGFGLGLAVCRALTEASAGRIDVEIGEPRVLVVTLHLMKHDGTGILVSAE